MKIKKRTRAQILERLHEIAYDKHQIEKYIQFDEPNKYITVINTLHKGETMSEVRCLNCGEKYIRQPIWGYAPPSVEIERFQCPNCGNQNIVRETNKRLESNRRKLMIKTKDGFEFVHFTHYAKFNSNNDNWYELNPQQHIEIDVVGIFDRNSGFYIASLGKYDRQYKVLRRFSYDEECIVRWLKDFTNSNVSNEECEKLLQESNACYAKQKEESKARSAIRQKKKEEEKRAAEEERARIAEKRRQEYEEMRLADKRWMYEANPVDIESLFEQPIMCSLYSAPNGESATFLVGCGKCGVVEEITGIEIGDEYTCPHCGNHVEHVIPSRGSNHSEETRQTAIMFENTNLSDNDLLIRVFYYNCYLNYGNVEKEAYEGKRLFAGKEPAVYWKSHPNNRFEKSEDMDRFCAPCGDGTIFPQNDERIVEIVNNSCLKYSGLLDSWGMGKCKYNWSVDMPNLMYLKAWYINPAIEIVMKSNLTKITDWLIDNPDYIKSGKSLHEILNISPGIVKAIVKMDPHPRTMSDMASLYEADNSMTEEIYNQIVQADFNRTTLKHLVTNYSLTYDKILKYLQAAYDHQCILKRETLSVWSDYLRMASAIGVDLNNKAKKFPSSLKKEHDIVMFAYRAVQIEMDAKVFAQQAEVNAKYEFDDDDEMMVIVPRTPQAVIEEANAQNNCLRSYVERVKRGETVVAFVRKKSEPDKTFLSAEIRDGELVQLKGWCNSDPRNKEIVAFTKKWAKACNIIIKC